jgi:sialic acid synthase SpsE
MEIIAEIGQNHNGDMSVAVQLIKAAKERGADVAKFQVFEARTLFPPREQNEWFDYNCKTELTRDQVKRLADECAKIGIEFMASVFDVERIAWLEEVGVKRYKVASRSIEAPELIAALIATGKPLIASLGQWKKQEFPNISAKQPVDYLYCISKYPTALEDLHFAKVDFNTKYAGFSDHTLGLTAPMAAFARGARIVEKHLTLDRGMYGPDHAGSMTPDDLAAIHRFRTELAACL